MRLWFFWLRQRWRGAAAGLAALLVLALVVLLSLRGSEAGLTFLGRADAPRNATSAASGATLPRSGGNQAVSTLPDITTSLLDAPVAAGAGAQTVAEAQAAWSADILRLRQQAVLAEINCARQSQRLPVLTLDAQLTQTAGNAWLRLAHEPSFSLMQLAGQYRLRSVLPLTAEAPVSATSCAAGDFDAVAVSLTGGATSVGIAVFPPQASWDLPSAVVLIR
jgi:hypothetical protein